LTAIVQRSEITRSLETGQRRLALSRAHALFTLTEQVFAVAKGLTDLSLAEEEVAPLIRRLHEESPWSGPTLQSVLADIHQGKGNRLKAIVENGQRIIDSLPAPKREQVMSAIERMMEAERAHVASIHTEALTKQAESLRIRHGLETLHRIKEDRERLAKHTAQLEDLKAVVSKTHQAMMATPDGPTFSELQEAFLAERAKGNDAEKPWSADVVAQARTTFAMFLSLVGDVKVATLTRQQVGRFKADVLSLPTNWGKSQKFERSAQDWIDSAKASKTKVPTLSAKTVKRHFSALSGYWRWLEQRDLVPVNVWGGWFRTTKKKSGKAVQPFSPANLVKILSSDWFTEATPWDSPRRWVPLIALFSGMRLEEICRLRPAYDIKAVDGILCFDICEHPDGWTPKSEAGTRVVPVHPVLIDLGIERLVAHNRKLGAVHLFPEYERLNSIRRKKLGAVMTRDFSYLKSSRLKLPKNQVFHSFRHTVATALHNANPPLPRDWIDAMMGHAVDEGESEGRKTYTAGYTTANLQAVVNALVYPSEILRIISSTAG
jgi:integrase